ncbi:hypothetical protein MMC12_004155 [Toensbergia leucococca]|nr:hypothetical protein [Toensbergia leucococca]
MTTITPANQIFSLDGQSLKLDTAADLTPHLTPLLENPHITEIRLGGNTLGVPACTHLATILPTKKDLQTANLADIFTSRLLSEIPPAISALLTSLLPLQNLHTLDLSDNAFGLNTQAPLVEFLGKHVPLRHLVLNNNGLGPAAGALVAYALIALAERKEEARRAGGEVCGLETLVCGRNRLESGSMRPWSRVFRAHSGVKVVRMVQNGIRQDGVFMLLREGLRQCKGLEVLDLQDNTFTAIGAGALAEVVGGWTELRELGVGDCLLGGRGAVVAFEALGKGRNQALRVLRAQYNEIDARGVGALVKGVKGGGLEGLRRVELNGNRFSEDEGAVEELRVLLEGRRGKEGEEGEWGLDELSDLEEESDGDDGEEEGENEEEEEEEREGVLKDAEREEESTVSQKKDKDVDALADELGRTEI